MVIATNKKGNKVMRIFDLIFKAYRTKDKKKSDIPKAKCTIDAKSQILALCESFKRNGFKEYEFIANKNCCKECAALNGKHFPVSKLKIGVNAPPLHDGCRCSIAAYDDDDEYEAWLDHLSKGGSTATWEKKKKRW